jgi:hypothetical protein
MEYIDGKTLSAVKLEKPKRVFEVDELKSWMTQACHALMYAHQDVGIIHRDLKPGNLMLSSRGQIKIADFGIAQGLSDSMARTTIRRGTSGTLSYMSPQQMNGEVCQITDDVYALGATIFELLTSKPPFHSGNISFQVRVMIPPTMQERRDELEIRGSEIPKVWEDAIAACLSKVPEDRPRSMQELAERLELVRPRHTAPLPKIQPREKKPVLTEVKQRIKASLPEKLPAWKLPEWRWTGSKSRKVALLTVSSVVLSLALGFAWQSLLWPQLATRAAVRIASTPAGATVHIQGFPDSVTPSTVSGLRIGDYAISVSAPGFDSIQKKVHLSPGEHLDLGTLTLNRAYGQWAITTLPSRLHYTLTGDANTGSFVKSGTAPDSIASLPSGTYVLTITSPAFPTFTETLQVPAHGTKTDKIDLISASLVGSSNDDAARAFRGETPITTLDSPAKNELTSLLNRAFEQYLAAGNLNLALQQLDRLEAMQVDVTSLQKRIDVRIAARENELGNAIAGFIGGHKLASADNLLKSAADDLPKASLDRLNVRFAYALEPYARQVDALLKSLQGVAPAVAQPQLEKWIDLYPDDTRIQVALADLLPQLPPNRLQISKLLASLQHPADPNKAPVADAAGLRAVQSLSGELKQIDAQAKAADDAKSALSAETGEIARLKNQESAYEDRRIGRPKENPFASTLNFFGKVVTGHRVVDNEAVFSSREEKDDAIASVKAQIDTGEATLPSLQAASDVAQKSYQDFLQTAPWSASDKAN